MTTASGPIATWIQGTSVGALITSIAALIAALAAYRKAKHAEENGKKNGEGT